MTPLSPVTPPVTLALLDKILHPSEEAIALVGYLRACRLRGAKIELRELAAELERTDKHDNARPLADKILSGGKKGLLRTLDKAVLQDLERCYAATDADFNGLDELDTLALALMKCNRKHGVPPPTALTQLLMDLCPKVQAGPVLCLTLAGLPVATRFAQQGITSVVTGVPDWFGVIVRALGKGQIVPVPGHDPLAGAVKDCLGEARTAQLIVGALPGQHMLDAPRSGTDVDPELDVLRQACDLLAPDGRAVLLSHGGLVGRTTPKYSELKKNLLAANILEGVIALPEVITSWSNSHLLIIARQRKEESYGVRMVNAGAVSPGSARNAPSRRISPASAAKIAEAYRDIAVQPGISSDVRAEEIQRHRYSLDVQRYVMSDRGQRALEILGRLTTAKLGEIADMVRAQVVPEPDHDNQKRLTLREASGTDIDDAGQVIRPEREREVALTDESERRLQAVYLHKDDVILSYKGRIGVVGLMAEEPEGEHWTVNQSLMILRIKPAAAGRITPALLFWYLQSDLAQEWLKMHATGNVVQLLSTSDLKLMPVPMPTESELPALQAAIEKHFDCYARIRALRQEAVTVRGQCWSVG